MLFCFGLAVLIHDVLELATELVVPIKHSSVSLSAFEDNRHPVTLCQTYVHVPVNLVKLWKTWIVVRRSGQLCITCHKTMISDSYLVYYRSYAEV